MEIWQQISDNVQNMDFNNKKITNSDVYTDDNEDWYENYNIVQSL